jgi:hypothetical protein
VGTKLRPTILNATPSPGLADAKPTRSRPLAAQPDEVCIDRAPREDPPTKSLPGQKTGEASSYTDKSRNWLALHANEMGGLEEAAHSSFVLPDD